MGRDRNHARQSNMRGQGPRTRLYHSSTSTNTPPDSESPAYSRDFLRRQCWRAIHMLEKAPNSRKGMWVVIRKVKRMFDGILDVIVKDLPDRHKIEVFFGKDEYHGHVVISTKHDVWVVHSRPYGGRARKPLTMTYA